VRLDSLGGVLITGPAIRAPTCPVHPASTTFPPRDHNPAGEVCWLCPDAPAPILDDPTERVRPGGAALAAPPG